MILYSSDEDEISKSSSKNSSECSSDANFIKKFHDPNYQKTEEMEKESEDNTPFVNDVGHAHLILLQSEESFNFENRRESKDNENLIEAYKISRITKVFALNNIDFNES